MTVLLTSVASNFEAEMVVGRLADAGITAEIRGPIMVRSGDVQGGRDLWVEERDLERARAALKDSEGIDEAELARLSEAAGREQGPAED
jgi:Putative prokaryotic signal transducing protein